MTKRIFEIAFEVVTFLLMFAAIYAIFIYAPIEKNNGDCPENFLSPCPCCFFSLFLAFFITFFGQYCLPL